MGRNVILVRIGGALQIAGNPPNAVVGTAYSYTFNIVGGASPFTITHSTTPAWVTWTISGSQITLSGTPGASDTGTVSFSITVVDGGRNLVIGNYAVQVVALPLTLSGHLPNQTQGVAITPYSYTASGGYGGYAYSISAGALPTGLSLNASTGQVTGTPSTSGTYSWTVKVTDSNGGTITLNDSDTVSAAALAVSGSFGYTIGGNTVTGSQTLSGGVAPYSVSVLSGTPPSGITFGISGSTCTASGTNTTVGTYTFTLRYTSADNQTVDSPQTVKIAWYAPLFAAGEKGLVFDINDLSTLFQDTAGTTAVTASGQTVKAIKCKRSGILITNATGIALAFDSVKSLYYLNCVGTSYFDNSGGVDTSLLGSSAKTLICGWNPDATTPSYPFNIGGQTASRDAFGIANDGNYNAYTIGSGGAIVDTLNQTGLANYIATQDTSNPNVLSIYKDTTLRRQGAIGSPAANITTNRATLCGYGGGTTYGRITSPLYHGVIVGRIITSTEMSNVVTNTGF